MAKNHMGLDSKQMWRTFHEKILKQLLKICGRQYGAKRALYDRPETQLSWAQLAGAIVDVDPRKYVGADVARRWRSLAVA
jgi:hypothetical protein